jgi:hypothetical protein
MKRLTIGSMLFAAALALPAAGVAKGRPQPVSCPTDVATGVATACPCNGTIHGATLVPWRNHGQYVSCVARYRNALRKAGCLDVTAKRTVVSCAAHAECGKRSARVACCTTTLGVCSDPLPDGVAAGTCDNTGAACDVADDCAMTTTSFVDAAEGCTAGGGVVEGTGAVCSVCGVR